MHEFGLIEEMLSIADKALTEQNAVGPVSQVTLVVGKLSGASPEALRTAFEAVSPFTRLTGAELVIEEPRPTLRCFECKAEREVDGFEPACPACGSGSVVIEGGRELRIASLDIDDEQEQQPSQE